jgi:Ca2+-transporting ATPase
MKTRMGTIATLLNEAESGASPLQEKLQRLGVKLGLVSLAISAVVFIVGAILNRKPEPDSDQNVFLQLLLLSVSLTVAAVPEGLPAAVTITLALGMRRMVSGSVYLS